MSSVVISKILQIQSIAGQVRQLVSLREIMLTARLHYSLTVSSISYIDERYHF